MLITSEVLLRYVAGVTIRLDFLVLDLLSIDCIYVVNFEFFWQIVYDETCINKNQIGIRTFLDVVVVGLLEVHVLLLTP